jgi:hypothetical protein
MSLERRLDRLMDFLRSAFVPRCQSVAVPVRHDRLVGLSRSHFFTADEQGDFGLVAR